MKVRIDVNDIIYLSQGLAEIKAALDAGKPELAKTYVEALLGDVNDALRQL
jgi:hypothetical protein